VQAAVIVTLVVVSLSLLVAVAQGPGTIDPAIAAEPTPTRRPPPVGDSGVRPSSTSAPAVAVLPAGTPVAPVSKEPEALSGYRWPIQRKARLTGFYEHRDTGFLAIDGQRIHEGLDMASFCGDNIRAAHDGVVLAAGRRFADHTGFSEPMDAFFARLERQGRMDDLPIVVVIDDGNGYRSVYVHLERVNVHVGRRVKAGDVIGYEGRTGNATGCHLHYELIRMDGPWMAVAKERVRVDGYPPYVRERVDPLRVLSLRDRGAARLVPGILRPRDPPRQVGSAAPEGTGIAVTSPDPDASGGPPVSPAPSGAPLAPGSATAG
jgi:murein DD-endopeptidase MepM/ murein hydrolase activator NlpD